MTSLEDIFSATKEEQLSFLDKLLSTPVESSVEIIDATDYEVVEDISIEETLATFKQDILQQVNSIIPEKGDNGKDGLNGKDGKDGKNGLQGQKGDKGEQGEKGQDGSNGVSVVSAEVTFDNHLVLTLSDGNQIDAGEIQVQSGGITQVLTQKGGETVTYQLRYDQISDTLAYKGEAPVGSPESSDTWRIQRLTYGADGDVTIEWADGSADLKYIWANRASLTYK